MNRRGFISLLAGAAGAPLVPWRALLDPVVVLPPRPKLIIPPMSWRPDIGQQVSLIADYGGVRPPPRDGRYSGYSHWALAQAIYLGGSQGWHFIGGEWMTERDRRDFLDTLEGHNQRFTSAEPVMKLAEIRVVRLHR